MTAPETAERSADDLLGSWQFIYGFVAAQYAAIALALFLVVRYWHKRSALSVLTAADRFRWRRFALGFAAFGAVHLSIFAITLGLDPRIEFAAPAPGLFLVLLATSLPILFVQTTTEEAVARGYLMQALGRFGLPLPIVLVASSVLFALAHAGNPEALGNPFLLSGYFAIGLAFAWAAVREGGIELVAGAHFVNNLFAAILVRSDDSVFPTPALFVTPAFTDLGPADIILAAFVPPLLFVLVVRFLIAKPA